jgi:predicted PurR-regulated permease PerM
MASMPDKAFEIKWLIVGALIVLGLLWMAMPFITPIVFALFLYYIARPVKRRLQPYIKNESLLTLLCLLVIAVPVLAVLGYALLLAIGQINSLSSSVGMPSLPPGPLSNMSSIAPLLQQGPATGGFDIGNLTATVQNIYGQLEGYTSTFMGIKNVLVSTGLTLVDFLFKLSLMIIVAFLLLIGDDRLAAWFVGTFPAAARERNGALVRFAKAVDSDLEAVFFGNMLSVIIFGIIAVVVYSVLNFFAPDPAFLIPYPLLLGVLCGLFAFMPILGPWMIDVPILLFAAARSLASGTFADHWWYLIVMAVVISIFVENLPNYLLRPFVSHGHVDVGLLMLAYIVGPVVFGIPGLFIGAILLVLATNYFGIIVPEMQPAGQHKKRLPRRASRRPGLRPRG